MKGIVTTCFVFTIICALLFFMTNGIAFAALAACGAGGVITSGLCTRFVQPVVYVEVPVAPTPPEVIVEHDECCASIIEARDRVEAGGWRRRRRRIEPVELA